ncbi:MAG: PAS domain S-box protein [Burkholderiales bacterium]
MSLRFKTLITLIAGATPLVVLFLGLWAAGEFNSADEPRYAALFLLAVVISLLLTAVMSEWLLRRPLTGLLNAAMKLGFARKTGGEISGDEVHAAAASLAAARKELSDRESWLQREIRQRQELESRLREVEERYVLAVRGSNDGLWEWDIKTDRAYFSPRWKALLGYGEGEISEHIDEWRKRIHADDRETVLAALHAHLEGQSLHFSSEHRMLHKDGTPRWVMVRGAAIRSAGGKAYRMVGLHTDISERKRAENVLVGIAEGVAAARGEAFFRTLVRNFARVLGVRRAFLTECVDSPATQVRMLAYWSSGSYVENKQFELAGTPCEEVIHQGKICFYPRGVMDIFPKEKKMEKAGAESYLGMPIFASSGAVTGHIALFDDKPMREDFVIEPVFKIFSVRAGAEIERLWTESQLYSEKEFKQKLLQNMDEAVITIDAKGAIIYLNPVAETLSGWDDIEAHGKPIESVFQVLEHNGLNPISRCLAAGGSVQSADGAVLITRDGARLPVQRWAASLFYQRGEIAGAVVLMDHGPRVLNS